jgi:hypothetical protein
VSVPWDCHESTSLSACKEVLASKKKLTGSKLEEKKDGRLGGKSWQR